MQQQKLFANKFDMEHDDVAIRCIEEHLMSTAKEEL